MYVDIQWFSALQQYDNNKIIPYTNTVYMHSDKWIVDGKAFVTYQDAIQISENLWATKCIWPSWKQQKRISEGYKYPDPIRTN